MSAAQDKTSEIVLVTRSSRVHVIERGQPVRARVDVDRRLRVEGRPAVELRVRVDLVHVEHAERIEPGFYPKNLLLTAHNADYTENYFDLGCQVFDENVEAFLKDSSGGAGPPAGMSTPVDLDQGY